MPLRPLDQRPGIDDVQPLDGHQVALLGRRSGNIGPAQRGRRRVTGKNR